MHYNKSKMDVNVYNSQKAITMHDIAREAGVSVATVSRFINNDGVVGADKSKRIQAAIEKFDYTPNRFAKGLKISRSMQIMLIVPDIKNPYYARLYDVLQNIAHREKYVVILYNTNESEESEFNALRLVSELNCDGVVFCSVSDGEEILARMQKLHKPIVASSSFEKKLFDTVHGIKPGQGVYLGTKYLIENNHTRIGFAGGNPRSVLNDRRMSGYCRAMQESTIPIRDEYVFSNAFSLEGGYRAGEYFARLTDRPTAIACANDMIAIGIMQYFRTVGIRVPEDISIVGMDNISMSEIVKPALTTVVNDSAEFAEKAAQLLFDRLLHGYKGGPRELFCGRTLIVRDSVKKI